MLDYIQFSKFHTHNGDDTLPSRMLVSDPSRRICLCYCVTAERWKSLLGLVCKEKWEGCLSFVRHSIPNPSDLIYTHNFAAEQWQRLSFLYQVHWYNETRITEALWRTFGCHFSSNFLNLTEAVVSFASGSSSFTQLLTDPLFTRDGCLDY